MHDLGLIFTITSALTAALLLGYVTNRLGLSPIVGYLLAGIVVGPHTPGIAADPAIAYPLAELGVILLMFGVGLHFHFRDLMAVRRIAIPGAIGQITLATLLGITVALAFGWAWSAGLVFGLAISVASTVVLLRVLVDNNDLHTPTGHIAVGWLIVEDLFTVMVLVVLPILFGEAKQGGQVVWVLGLSILKIAAFVAVVALLGNRLLHWVLKRAAETRSRELFTLTVLVLTLGIAVGAAEVFGVSMALGAFLAGMIVGRSEFSSRAASEALPMRDAFAVIFFVSIGMLFNPTSLWKNPMLLLATLAIVLIGKPIAALFIVWLLRFPIRVGLGVAIALAQIGEFSFILATVGRELEILSEAAINALVAAAIISIGLNPLFYRSVDWLHGQLKSFPRLFEALHARSRAYNTGLQSERDEDSMTAPQHAVVVGYGPVGRTLVRLLRESEIEPTIIELNLDAVQRLRADGFRAVYGDATHSATLKEAGTAQAMVIILSSSQMQRTDEAIRLARRVNPDIKVLARANHLREIPGLVRAGADAVFTGEGEVALTMNEFLMRQLGATPEQIDMEENRIRDEFFGSPATMEIVLPVPHREAPDMTVAEPASDSPGPESDASAQSHDDPAQQPLADDVGMHSSDPLPPQPRDP